MRVTVCELPSSGDALEDAWERLAAHTDEAGSALVVLPELGFSPWLSATKDVDTAAWAESVADHESWISRLGELGARVVVGTRPVVDGGARHNEAYVWDEEGGVRPAHRKVHLPDEPGFWEATWYEPGPVEFLPVDTPVGRVGFLVCSELWLMEEARAYGEAGVDLIVCPRATPASSTGKWVAGGRVAAVVSGAFCLSSNHAGDASGVDFGGSGWVAEPEEGEVVGLTNAGAPFLTVEIDLGAAAAAKSTYPRYLPDPRERAPSRRPSRTQSG